jgi:hypothetical protein
MNPVQFWKCISSFRKREKNSVVLEVDGNHASQPCTVAEPLAEYCKTVFSNPYLHDSSASLWSSDSLSSASVSDSFLRPLSTFKICWT